jgi:GxxExxY protein
MQLLYKEITNIILSACFDVINELGAGFLESVYQKSLLIALHQKSLKAIPEVPIGVSFRGQSV